VSSAELCPVELDELGGLGIELEVDAAVVLVDAGVLGGRAEDPRTIGHDQRLGDVARRQVTGRDPLQHS
jgi:hypothetical protein